MSDKRVLLLTPAAAKLERQKALVKGCQAHGYEVLDFGKRTDVLPDFAISSGMRNNSAAGRKFCEAHQIPVLVVELGYLRRSNNNLDTEGYFQCGWGRIGWIPTGPVPADRWEALGLTLRPLKEVRPEQHVLLAGQVGFDAQHNKSSHDLGRWLMQEARALNEGRVVPYSFVFRPHPMQPHTCLLSTLKHMRQNPKVVGLDKALEDTQLLVTYNSTLGVEAMLRGVPVRSHSSAHYYTAAVSKDEQERQDYMHHLAYAQWRLPELAEGKALEFLLQNRA